MASTPCAYWIHVGFNHNVLAIAAAVMGGLSVHGNSGSHIPSSQHALLRGHLETQLDAHPILRSVLSNLTKTACVKTTLKVHTVPPHADTRN
jgi:ribose/xylose/arabinose/galactoside ABC-type transport system permease subunit